MMNLLCLLCIPYLFIRVFMKNTYGDFHMNKQQKAARKYAALRGIYSQMKNVILGKSLSFDDVIVKSLTVQTGATQTTFTNFSEAAQKFLDVMGIPEEKLGLVSTKSIWTISPRLYVFSNSLPSRQPEKKWLMFFWKQMVKEKVGNIDTFDIIDDDFGVVKTLTKLVKSCKTQEDFIQMIMDIGVMNLAFHDLKTWFDICVAVKNNPTEIQTNSTLVDEATKELEQFSLLNSEDNDTKNFVKFIRVFYPKYKKLDKVQLSKIQLWYIYTFKNSTLELIGYLGDQMMYYVDRIQSYRKIIGNTNTVKNVNNDELESDIDIDELMNKTYEYSEQPKSDDEYITFEEDVQDQPYGKLNLYEEEDQDKGQKPGLGQGQGQGQKNKQRQGKQGVKQPEESQTLLKDFNPFSSSDLLNKNPFY